MQVLKVTTLGVAMAVMSACSSSGSDTAAPAPQPVVSAPTTTTPTTSSIQGNIIKVSEDQVVVSDINKTAATTQVNKVVINGQILDFVPAHFSAGKLNMRSGNIDRVGGGNLQLSYTRYGYIREGSAGPAVFAQGEVTPINAVPKTGTATYQGSAAHVVPGEVSLVDSSFTVDFAKQQVQGVIKAPAGDVNLAATINGNAFSGVHNGMQTQGMFYGSQAQELGGVYADTTGLVSGAYGAKR